MEMFCGREVFAVLEVILDHQVIELEFKILWEISVCKILAELL